MAPLSGCPSRVEAFGIAPDDEWSSHYSDASDPCIQEAAQEGGYGGGGGGGRETAEKRVLELYGESVLQLSKDQFKQWQASHAVRRLTPKEKEAFKKVRRRVLGRTYAQVSRNKQLEKQGQIIRECERLSAENAQIRLRIAALQQQLVGHDFGKPC